MTERSAGLQACVGGLTSLHTVSQSVAIMAVRTTGPAVDGAQRVLTAAALAFVEDLTKRFVDRIDELLARRRAIQARFNTGERPDFLKETASVRSGDWRVAPPPDDVGGRRVEVTGPVARHRVRHTLSARTDG